MEEAKIHCAIVVFNLGLVSQRVGQQAHCTASVQATTLQQSRILYYQAYRLLAPFMEDSYKGASSGNALLDLLYMAVLNNWLQAILECESFATGAVGEQSEQTTRQVSARLIRLAVSVRSSHYISSYVGNQEEQEVTVASPLLRSLADFCLVNASAARLFPRTIAPAA